MSYHWPAEHAWQHGFSDFCESQKIVELGRQKNRVAIHDDVVEYAESDHKMSANIRKQLLQSLAYLPTSVVGQPKALEKLKHDLRTRSSFCWKDYATEIAQIWRYPAPVNQG